jgi:SAM-dependent methyltransferase
MLPRVDLYGNSFGHFDSAAETAVRRETYGDDIGQTSWTTKAEWLHLADLLGVRAGQEVLDVGSGSGGPALCLVEERACRVTGVEVSAAGVANAQRLTHARGLGDRARFVEQDASRPLPFPADSFDAIIANDAVCHLAARQAVLAEWARVVRPGGRVLFSDALVVTGPVTNEEIATRTSVGFYVLVPTGENERIIGAAGLVLRGREDLTASAATIARRRHEARERHRRDLTEHEGEATFAALQRYLEIVVRLSEERRLCRHAYLAEKPVG